MLNKNLSNESRSQRLEREALASITTPLTLEEQKQASIDAAAAEVTAKCARLSEGKDYFERS